jgi:hypothetical protein
MVWYYYHQSFSYLYDSHPLLVIQMFQSILEYQKKENRLGVIRIMKVKISYHSFVIISLLYFRWWFSIKSKFYKFNNYINIYTNSNESTNCCSIYHFNLYTRYECFYSMNNYKNKLTDTCWTKVWWRYHQRKSSWRIKKKRWNEKNKNK